MFLDFKVKYLIQHGAKTGKMQKAFLEINKL
jgi:hypothetical protein